MPETDSEIAGIVSRIPTDVKKRYVDGRTQAVIEFSTVDMENDVGMSMMDQMRKDLEWNKPPIGTSASVTGMGEMFSNLIREIRQGKMLMTILGFGLIFGLLLVIYRKVIKTATPLVPIILIVGWNGLIMFLLGIDYTPLTATLGSMSVGVASEYTILIMERCYEERANGLAIIPAIQQSVGRWVCYYRFGNDNSIRICGSDAFLLWHHQQLRAGDGNLGIFCPYWCNHRDAGYSCAGRQV